MDLTNKDHRLPGKQLVQVEPQMTPKSCCSEEESFRTTCTFFLLKAYNFCLTGYIDPLSQEEQAEDKSKNHFCTSHLLINFVLSFGMVL